MIEFRFLQPLDVLHLRGNKLFGDPGSYGESLMPPWPSVAAGAIRSRMLADEGIALSEFAAGRIPHPVLGTPMEPGSFTLKHFSLAQRSSAGVTRLLRTLPADLLIKRDRNGRGELSRLNSVVVSSALACSAVLPRLAVLVEDARGKPESGWWLNQVGWDAYVRGQQLQFDLHLVHADTLWKVDERVGIGLEPEKRRADDGKLFTYQAIALGEGVGFLVGVEGANLPDDGTVRFGGDGRFAAISAASDCSVKEPDYAAIASSKRCRVVLDSPGLFEGGWQLPGMMADGRWQLGDVTGTIACAAVPRAEVISGWDLAAREGKGGPKPALRAAPAGSVYWIENLEASPDALRKLSNAGLWKSTGENPTRRAEGYNRFSFAIA